MKRKFKVTIPYWDSGVKKRFESEFIVEAVDKKDAEKLAIKSFNEYEKNNYASWVRLMYEAEIRVEEVQE
jgi:hypothetical protein